MTSQHVPALHMNSVPVTSINDLPFFCAMECKIRNRTNIWIKFRTGDDASYMKMIRSSSH
ncbi:MAG: hypothetical protein HY062_03815 [Bacteroidetes bacterium]|nr:hypothetical protein [Bacteroidota bacterium]